MTVEKASQSKPRNDTKIIILIFAIVFVVGGLLSFSAIYFRMKYKPFMIQMSAMVPTLSPEDRIITRFTTNNSEIKRGDIIIFTSDQKMKVVKRVIGLPGETIEIKEGKLLVDEKEVEENYIKFKDLTSYGPKEIKNNHYFVMGDNRPNSRDSRIFGPIKKDTIVGKVIFRYYPFDSIGTLYSVDNAIPDKPDKSSKPKINKNINPIYVLTTSGIIVIDPKTDEVIVEDQVIDKINVEEIRGVSGTRIFTSAERSGSKSTEKESTMMFDLEKGALGKVSGSSLYSLVSSQDYVYGVGYANEILFLYDKKKQSMVRKIKNDTWNNSPMYFATFIGFVSYSGNNDAILVATDDGLQVATVGLDKTIKKFDIKEASVVMIDDNRVLIPSENFVVLNIKTGARKKLPIKVKKDITFFVAYDKLFIGSSTGLTDDNKAVKYDVYLINDGKKVKTIMMDLKESNVIKLDNLLVFLNGPQLGQALNLKTASLQYTDIPLQSVLNDGKIYSAIGYGIEIRRISVGKRRLGGEMSGTDTKDTISLNSESEKQLAEVDSIYNRAIFTSETQSDNFSIMVR